MDNLFLENYLNMTSQEIDIDQLTSTLLGVPDSILPSDKEIPNTPVELQSLLVQGNPTSPLTLKNTNNMDVLAVSDKASINFVGVNTSKHPVSPTLETDAKSVPIPDLDLVKVKKNSKSEPIRKIGGGSSEVNTIKQPPQQGRARTRNQKAKNVPQTSYGGQHKSAQTVKTKSGGGRKKNTFSSSKPSEKGKYNLITPITSLLKS